MVTQMLFMQHWLDKIESCTEEQQKEIVWLVLKYGLYEEYTPPKDNAVKMALDFILPQVDNMKEKYDNQIMNGKKGGRPKTIDDGEIWRLAHDEGLNGTEIAERLKVPKTTVYSSSGWKERKNAEFLR